MQFARHIHQVQPAYAIKFFQSQASLDSELQLYSADNLKQLLPPIISIQREGDALARGGTLPPLMVVAAGEGLDEWFSRSKPEFLEATMVRLLSLQPACISLFV